MVRFQIALEKKDFAALRELAKQEYPPRLMAAVCGENGKVGVAQREDRTAIHFLSLENENLGHVALKSPEALALVGILTKFLQEPREKA